MVLPFYWKWERVKKNPERKQANCRLFQRRLKFSNCERKCVGCTNLRKKLFFLGRCKLTKKKKWRTKLTKGLTHQREVSCDGRCNAQGQSHDRKGHSASTFRGCSGHHRAEDHGDGHQVVSWKDGKVVVFYGQNPPYCTSYI